MRTMVTEIRMAPTGLVSWSRNKGSVWPGGAEQGQSAPWAQECLASAHTHLHGGRIHQQQRHQQLVAFVHELQASRKEAEVRRRRVRAHTAHHHHTATRTGATAAACFFCVSVPLRLSTWGSQASRREE